MGLPTSVSSATLTSMTWRRPCPRRRPPRAPRCAAAAARASPPRREGVVGDRPEVVDRAGELVGADAVGLDGVVDDRRDVGVLQQQRALARAVEGVPEGPHLVAVHVGDRADRRERDVAAGDAHADGRAGLERQDPACGRPGSTAPRARRRAARAAAVSRASSRDDRPPIAVGVASGLAPREDARRGGLAPRASTSPAAPRPACRRSARSASPARSCRRSRRSSRRSRRRSASRRPRPGSRPASPRSPGPTPVTSMPARTP